METTSVDVFKKLFYKRQNESRTLNSKSLEQGLVNDRLKACPWPVSKNKVLFEHSHEVSLVGLLQSKIL